MSSILSPEDFFPLLELEDGEAKGNTLSYSPLLPGLEKDQRKLFPPTASIAFFEDLLTDPFFNVLRQPHRNDSSPPKSSVSELSVIGFENPVETATVMATSVTYIDPQTITCMNAAEIDGSMEFTPLAPSENRKVSSPPDTIGFKNTEESPQNMDLVTPQPPQSLLRKYSRTCICNKSGSVRKDSPMVLETPRLAASPPRTCVLLKPSSGGRFASQDMALESPVIFLKSPFRTPGLFLRQARSSNSTPSPASAKTQFTNIAKLKGERTILTGSEYATPSLVFEETQLTTVTKPGFPQPGEQTLKKELWSRLEADFASSIADVCKSLFPETKADLLSSSKECKKDMARQEMDHPQPPIFPGRLQGLSCKFR